ncbi:MAG: hypothetical protein KAW17_13330, partial [Candidatus Eisenbacteria sp.]|nr:hypothetical protein [Candidatus Eisenbacteria bacterium]
LHYAFALKNGIRLYRDIATDPSISAKWAGRGIKVDALPLDAIYTEHGQGWIHRAASWSANNAWWKSGGVGWLAGKVTLSLGNWRTNFDNFLWHGMLPTMKITMAERMYENFRKDPELVHLSDEKIGNDVALWVNDALGGQEWEQYLMMSPMMQDLMNTLWFAPDWTLSALNVAGLTTILGKTFGMEGRMNFTDDANNFTRSPLMKRRLTKYIPGFYWHAMVMPSLVMQALSYEMFGGDDDKGDARFFWNNKGQNWWDPRPDITPAVRAYRKMWGVTTELGSRVLLTPGKQIREIWGWLRHPIHTAWGKSGSSLKALWLLASGKISAPFTPKEDEWVSENRFADTAAMFTPFIVQGYLKDISKLDQQDRARFGVPNSDVPLLFRTVMPIKRGDSRYKLSMEATDIMLGAAHGSTAQRWFKKVGVELPRRSRIDSRKAFRASMKDLKVRAKLNGVDYSEVLIEGRRGAREVLNRHYYKILSRRNKKQQDWRDLSEVMAASLFISGGDEEGFKALEAFVKRKYRHWATTDSARKELTRTIESARFEMAEERAAMARDRQWSTTRLDVPQSTKEELTYPEFPEHEYGYD